MQLKRQVEGGAMMGISIALLEEVTFDESGVTQDDWLSYPILTMADIPEIKVELIHNPKVGKYGGGSEAANALAAPAIAAAFHDATGKSDSQAPDETRLCAGCFEGVSGPKRSSRQECRRSLFSEKSDRNAWKKDEQQQPRSTVNIASGRSGMGEGISDPKRSSGPRVVGEALHLHVRKRLAV